MDRPAAARKKATEAYVYKNRMEIELPISIFHWLQASHMFMIVPARGECEIDIRRGREVLVKSGSHQAKSSMHGAAKMQKSNPPMTD